MDGGIERENESLCEDIRPSNGSCIYWATVFYGQWFVDYIDTYMHAYITWRFSSSG